MLIPIFEGFNDQRNRR